MMVMGIGMLQAHQDFYLSRYGMSPISIGFGSLSLIQFGTQKC